MQKLFINKITDENISKYFESERWQDAFYKAKNYADVEISLQDLNNYMNKNKFIFNIVKQGNGFVFLNIKDRLSDIGYSLMY